METIVDLIKFLQEVMMKGAHVHLFCYSPHLRTWFRTVRIAKEEVDLYE